MKDYFIFSIFLYLLKNRQTTAKKIADEFEISPRSVYRYIDALSLIGVPVVTKLGRNGGLELIGDFRIDSMLLSQKDKEIINESIKSGKVDEGLCAVLKKLV